MFKKILLSILIATIASPILVVAQDSLLTKIAKENSNTFIKTPIGFDGLGWSKILEKAQLSNNVLIGEDHFTNEIPFFTSKLVAQIKFDNFIAEIDPYTAKIMETKLKSLSADALKRYVETFGNTFSFYAFDPELDLLKQLVAAKTNLYGTDQILLVADRLICNELIHNTKNARAKVLYQLIRDQSKLYFDQFLKDQSKPFFMLTPEYDKSLNELANLKLSHQEEQIISSLKLTAKIYKSRDHHLRIQLMKNQLMKHFEQINGKKNLYKFGANHMAKSESVLHDIYDIGNLVNNFSDSEFKESLHMMVLGKSGMQASPFAGFPAEKVDPYSGMLKSLMPFFNLVNGNEWYVFDLKPILKAIETKKITVTDAKLLRIIKGFDVLVIIPEVTAAKFPS